jgi:transposase-like protein
LDINISIFLIKFWRNLIKNMSMFKCDLCSKTFTSKFNLERHKNNKKPCNAIKESYNCDICKSNFDYKAHLDIHNKTKKHINNYNVHIENLNFNNRLM